MEKQSNEARCRGAYGVSTRCHDWGMSAANELSIVRGLILTLLMLLQNNRGHPSIDPV